MGPGIHRCLATSCFCCLAEQDFDSDFWVEWGKVYNTSSSNKNNNERSSMQFFTDLLGNSSRHQRWKGDQQSTLGELYARTGSAALSEISAPRSRQNIGQRARHEGGETRGYEREEGREIRRGSEMYQEGSQARTGGLIGVYSTGVIWNNGKNGSYNSQNKGEQAQGKCKYVG